jgi:organic hydroperoxide reductase OsmC/OhrA
MQDLFFTFDVVLTWTGQPYEDHPFDTYTGHSRREPVLSGSSDPYARADRHRPQDLLIGAVAQDHLGFFLHLAHARGIVVVDYVDHASGMHTLPPRGQAGSGQLTRVVLRPRVRILDDRPLPDGSPVTDEVLAALHDTAVHDGIVARSVNFPVLVEPAPLLRGPWPEPQ